MFLNEKRKIRLLFFLIPSFVIFASISHFIFLPSYVESTPEISLAFRWTAMHIYVHIYIRSQYSSEQGLCFRRRLNPTRRLLKLLSLVYFSFFSRWSTISSTHCQLALRDTKAERKLIWFHCHLNKSEGYLGIREKSTLECCVAFSWIVVYCAYRKLMRKL